MKEGCSKKTWGKQVAMTRKPKMKGDFCATNNQSFYPTKDRANANLRRRSCSMGSRISGPLGTMAVTTKPAL
jgi:hypothetical protein